MVDAPLRGKRGNKPGASEVELAKLGAAVFNGVAMVRGPHWAKSDDQMMPLARPLHDYLSTLPASKASALAGFFAPLSILMGAIMVLQEPVATEVVTSKMRTYERAQAAAARRANANTGAGNHPQANFGGGETGRTDTGDGGTTFSARADGSNPGVIDASLTL